MLILKGFLLVLLMLEVHGHKGKVARLISMRTEKAKKVQPLFKHCDNIFKAVNLDVQLITVMLEEVKKRLDLELNCKAMGQVPTILCGGLYCGQNLPTVIQSLLSYVQSDSDRDCKKLEGFHSEYFKGQV